jgi:hypothetical protein
MAGPANPEGTAPAAPAVPAVAVPVVATPEPVAAPVVETPVVETPAIEPVEKPVDEWKPATTLLATEPPKSSEAPLETAPAEEPKPEDTPAITYEPFKLPEGIQYDEAAMRKASEVFAAQKLPQDAAQTFIDLHVAEMTRLQDSALQHQRRTFDDTVERWAQEYEQKAGPRRDTMLREASYGRDQVLTDARYGGSPELLQAFTDVMNYTGVGNHWAIIQAFAAVGRMLEEPAPITEEVRPVADRGPAANTARGRAAQRYPNMVNGNKSGF